ncbi:CHAT domain-containing protein [Frankia sp. CiP3]|uniref:CHAT domain-containing protein n=1 Tax=Frankia sp. CiP3 TaxID=2880971 RepID=UPI001EF40DEE|nr:CHAT domain-containing protein [Frankia sp. CiP3]
MHEVAGGDSRLAAEFDIRAEPADAGTYMVNLYRYDYASHDGGRDRSKTLLTYGEAVPEAELRAVQDRVACCGPQERWSEATQQEVGSRLFALINRGCVATAWANLQDDNPERVQLALPGPGKDRGKLRSLPWELIYECQVAVDRPGPGFLFQDAGRPWSLSQAGYRGRGAKREPGPLRVLVVICEPRRLNLLADQEVAGIAKGLAGRGARVHTDVLDAPVSIAKLGDRIDSFQPHILHFIGHSRSDGHGASMLNFVSNDCSDWRLRAWHVKKLCEWNEWKPSLVIINACRTEGGGDGGDMLDLTQAFLDTGADGVVAMRTKVESGHADTFSRVFYEELGRRDARRSIDHAIAVARFRLRWESAAWAVPRLVTTTAPDEVLHSLLHGWQDDDEGRKNESAVTRLYRGYPGPETFVDRYAERRQVRQWSLNEGTARGARKNVLVISGEERSGRSWLARWALATMRLHGHRITYVDCGLPLQRRGIAKNIIDAADHRYGRVAKEWLDVLHAIFEAVTDGNGPEPIPRVEFADFFNYAYTAESRLKDVVEPGYAIEFFLSCLWRASREVDIGRLRIRPHVIAIDNLRMNDQQYALADSREFGYLREHLIQPVVQGNAEPLRILLVDGVREPLESVWGSFDRLSLDDIAPAEFIRLCHEYMARCGWRFRAPGEGAGVDRVTAKKLLDAYMRTNPDKARTFAGLDQACRAAELFGVLEEWAS